MPLDDMASLLANAGITPETTDADKLIKIMTEMKQLHEIIGTFKHAQVDSTEYACLKAIALFKTGRQTHTHTHLIYFDLFSNLI